MKKRQGTYHEIVKLVYWQCSPKGIKASGRGIALLAIYALRGTPCILRGTSYTLRGVPSCTATAP